MSIRTYYVKAKSKKAINEDLAAGKKVYAEDFSLFGNIGMELDLRKLNNGDVIKIYDKEVGGSPYAKAYGNWDAKKQRVK